MAASNHNEEVVKWLEEPYEIEGHNVVIGASIGIAITPHEAISAGSATSGIWLSASEMAFAGSGCVSRKSPSAPAPRAA